MLHHVGRRSGLERTTVLEVVGHDDAPPTWYVAAAWGDQSDWFRNLIATPRGEIHVGRHHHRVVARVVDVEEAARVFAEYVRNHPWAARILGRVLGIDLLHLDPSEVTARIPLVALTADAPDEAPADAVARVVTTRAETQATYDRIAPIYEAVEGVWERRARAAGLAALAPNPGESVIEIGCGPGNALVEILRRVGRDGRAAGVDLAYRMCSNSSQRIVQSGLPGFGVVVQSDAVDLPFADDAFDAAFLSFTLELFDTPEIPSVLAECQRVLGPAGRLAVVALDKKDPAPAMQRVYEWGHGRLPSLLDCRPIHVEESLIDAGFAITAVRDLSLFGLPVAVVVGRKQ